MATVVSVTCVALLFCLQMPMSEKVLAQTRVGRAVNALCGHRSGRVRTMAKHLVRKWKELVLAPPAQRERPQPHEPVTDEERVRSSCRATLAARLTAACVSDADAASRVLAARSVGDMSVRDSASQARTDSAHSAHEVADSAPASATMQQEDQSTRASFDDPFFATAFSSDTAATTTTADSAGRLPSSQLLSIDTLIDEVAGAGEKAIWVAAGRRVGQSHGRVLRGVVSKMDADPTLAMRLLSGETTFENTIASEPQH